MEITIKGGVRLPSMVLAQSAVDNGCNIDDLIASMNEFSDQAFTTGECSKDTIIEWRKEVTGHYFDLLHQAGPMCSDFNDGDDEDDPSDSNI